MNMDISAFLIDMPVLYTNRLILRKIKLSDAADIYEYASDPEVTKYVAWDVHKSIKDTKKYIKLMKKKYKTQIIGDWGIVLKENNKMIGSCGFVAWNRQHDYAELGYVLSKQYWNRGIMTEAIKKVMDFGFSKMKLNRIEAYHLIDNVASEKVMIKSGMVNEGVVKQKFLANGIYNDAKLYAIVKEDFYSKVMY